MDAFTGEIRIFAGNFAPRNWAFCDGQLLPVSENTALFALLGTIYGGNGRTDFALPNLMGKAAVHQGRGPGLSDRRIGDTLGKEVVALEVATIPQHSHTVNCQTTANQTTPSQAVWADAEGRRGQRPYVANAETTMNANAVSDSGASEPHDNRQPFLGVSFIICLQGTFPARS